MDLWKEWYQRAQKYYYKNGNLDMPSNYVDEDGYNLGRWVCQQRSKYNKTDYHGITLSSEQIEKLESIGMVWSVLEQKWNDFYLSAKKYYEKNGDLVVPASYIDENGLKLGRWICQQRNYYYKKSERGTISEERIKKLEAIGMVWNPIGVQWEKCYSVAEHFFLENGHLCIPKKYEAEDGTNIATWVLNQRRKYRHQGDGELTDDQIKKLEKIGMMWNPYDEEWMRNYYLAKKYYENNGNLLVPLRYSTESGEHLGSWVSRQRKRKNGKDRELTPNEITLLNSIGMVWNPKEIHFEECYLEATDYFSKVGDLEIEVSYISTSGLKLGQWIANLRSAYKKGDLPKEKIKRLEDIGMLWTVDNSASQTSYPEQVVYYYISVLFTDAINRYSELGFELDIYIPSIKVGIEYDGSAWHKNKQANDNLKNELCLENGIELYRLREEKCPKLNGKSIDINIGKYTIQNVLDGCVTLFEHFKQRGYISSLPTINYNNDIVDIRKNYKNAKNNNWELMYKFAEQYFAKNGNLRVPYNYVTEDGYQLGSWITNQRSSYAGYSGTAIDSTRVEKLNKIGMLWSVPDTQWKIGYEEAKKYYSEHGNISVNIDYVTPTGFRLGIWIRTQRKSKLSNTQKKLLEDLGMIWSVFDDKWVKGFDEAKRYYSIHGDLRVPAGYITDSDYHLGSWIGTQRARYYLKNNEKALSDQQINRLEEIGMIWDRVDDLWQQGFIRAKDYYEKHGNLLVPSNYICEDGYNLGNWISSRRCAYHGTGTWAKLSKEQILMLEQIGMIWDVEEYMWRKNYSLAKKYYEDYGNLLVPKRYETENGEKLGLWIQRHRRIYAGKTKTKLSDERIKLLNDIGMIW